MTLAIPDKLHGIMKRHPEIKWTQVARSALEAKARELDKKDPALRRTALRHALEKWDEADELIQY